MGLAADLVASARIDDTADDERLRLLDGLLGQYSVVLDTAGHRLCHDLLNLALQPRHVAVQPYRAHLRDHHVVKLRPASSAQRPPTTRARMRINSLETAFHKFTEFTTGIGHFQ